MKIAALHFSASCALGATSGCAGESLQAPRFCGPGVTRLCRCDDGREGVQICNDIGQAFSACACDAPTMPPSPSFDGSTSPPTDSAAPVDGAPPADTQHDLPAVQPPPPPAGTLPCVDVAQCLLQCPPADIACLQQCVATASSSAQPLAQTLMSCLGTATSGACQGACNNSFAAACRPCLEGYCALQLGACNGS